MSHLSPEVLIDLAEGARPESSQPHLITCTVCRAQLAELRAMLTTTRDVDVPEPSPLFWDHLSARVREAVAAEAAGPRSWWRFGRLSWSLAGAMSVAVVVIVLSLTTRTNPQRVSRSPEGVPSVVAGAGDIRSGADDPSLSLLADLVGGWDWDAAAEAGLTMEVGATDDALTELTSAERLELQRLLHEAMSGSGV